MPKFSIKMLIVPALLLFSTIPAAAIDNPGEQNSTRKIIKYSPNLSSKDLTKHHDNDAIEMSNGKLINVGAIRKLDAIRKRMHTIDKTRTPMQFTKAPAATGVKLKNRDDLSSALKRSNDSETVVLPSGRRATVAQIKYLQPQVEKQLGKRLDAPLSKRSLTGPAIKVSKATSKDEWKNIIQKPDNTVLESPNGKRITVAELKQAVQERLKTRKAGRTKSSDKKSVEGGRP